MGRVMDVHFRARIEQPLREFEVSFFRRSVQWSSVIQDAGIEPPILAFGRFLFRRGVQYISLKLGAGIDVNADVGVRIGVTLLQERSPDVG